MAQGQRWESKIFAGTDTLGSGTGQGAAGDDVEEKAHQEKTFSSKATGSAHSPAHSKTRPQKVQKIFKIKQADTHLFRVRKLPETPLI